MNEKMSLESSLNILILFLLLLGLVPLFSRFCHAIYIDCLTTIGQRVF